ncbi:MFS transporter [Streptomyces sp. NPDC048638]|uniref:MFS transporter n=1 Tax=Streptomyces sp. NPDC048638 TaxID=3365580 RepID=UPI003720E83B
MGGTTLIERAERTEAPALPAAAGPDGPAVPPPGPGRRRLVRTGLLLALLPAALGQTVVATALPKIARELHGLPTTSGAITSYLLAAAIALPVHGKLGDLFGRKPAFLLAILLFVAGSALSGWSRSMDQLLAFRALQGLGAGGLLIGAHAITGDVVPPRARRRHLALTGAACGLAAVAGPLAGGLLTDHASWRWCFYATIPLGVAAFLVLALALELPGPPERPRPDIAGALLLAAFATCLALLTGRIGTEFAWDSPVTIGPGAGALAAALLFLTVEHFAAQPLLPLRLFRDCVFRLTGLVGAVVGLALFGATHHLPALLHLHDDVTATGAGLLTLPMTGGIALACLVSAPLIGRTGCTGRHRILPILGCAAAAAGMWLLSGTTPHTPRDVRSLWTALLGLGLGLVLPVLVLAARDSVRRHDPSPDPGAGHHLRQIGGSVGAALFGALCADRLAGRLAHEGPGPLTPQLARALPAELRDGHLAAYANAVPGVFRYLAPALVVGFLLVILRKEKPLVSHPSPASQTPQTSHLPYGEPDPSAGVPRARSAANGPSPATGYPGNPAGVPVCGTVQHHDGTIVPRAALTLIDVAGRQIGRGATGDDGRYALSTPGAGSYVLIAAAGGHQPQAVTVTVGERPVDLDVVLGGAGRLAGTVTTGDGTPVRDAMVTLTDVRGDVVATTRSGREGGYVIGELVAGEYTLASSAPAFRPAALPVTVQASRETRQDIELAGGAVLRGTVRAGGGRPVEDARVTLLDAAGNVVDTATTGPDGLFRFVDLSAGEYTVIAAGYPPVATVLQVAGGGRTERDLQLGHED